MMETNFDRMAERQRALHDPDRIPQGIMSSITRYMEHGTHPGSCVEAILANNLREAFARADVSTAEVMPAIVSYLYHHAPAVAWGSEGAVAAWMDGFAEKEDVS